MTLESLFTAFPTLSAVCEREEIRSLDTLRKTLKDPVAAPLLGLKAGTLAELRERLDLTAQAAPTPAAVVRVESFETMDLSQLLRAVVAGDAHALTVARVRAPYPVVTDAQPPVLLIADTVRFADVRTEALPAVYGAGLVKTWDVLYPPAKQMYCPFTGEPIVEGFATRSGYDYTGLADADLGLITAFAHDAALIAAQRPGEIIDTVRRKDFAGRLYRRAYGDYCDLPLSRKAALTEGVYCAPGRSGHARTERPLVAGGKQSDVGTLADILCALFTESEMRRLVKRHARIAHLEHSLPGEGSSKAAVAFGLAEYSIHHGCAADLIDVIAADVPRRAAEIRQTWASR